MVWTLKKIYFMDKLPHTCYLKLMVSNLPDNSLRKFYSTIVVLSSSRLKHKYHLQQTIFLIDELQHMCFRKSTVSNLPDNSLRNFYLTTEVLSSSRLKHKFRPLQSFYCPFH